MKLIECTVSILEAIVNEAGTEEVLPGITVPSEWPVEPDIFSHYLNQLRAGAAVKGWTGYLGIRDNRLVGDCGFLDQPDHFGKVEIGYSVVSEERCKGYASEMVKMVTDMAFSKGVKTIMARTEVSNRASIRVLEKCDFIPYMKKFYPDEGNMISWKKTRQ